MKSALVLALVGLALVGLPAFAQAEDDAMAGRVYVSGDVGANFLTDVDISIDPFVVQGNPAIDDWTMAAGGKQQAGPSFGAAMGFDGGGFAFEMRLDQSMSTSRIHYMGGSYDAKSSLTTLLFEPKVELRVGSLLDFYIGAGIGGAWYGFKVPGLPDPYYESIRQASLAYSAVGGVLFRLTDTLGIDVSYRYLSTPPMEYEDNRTIQPRVQTVQFGVRWYFADL